MTAVDETATTEREFGRARRRKEDARLITGRTRWTDNIVLPGMLHLAMVRSPVAHGRITSIDTSAAKDVARASRRLDRRRAARRRRPACRAPGRSPPT